MDFIGPLSLPCRGFRFTLHIIDSFSRFSAPIPTKTANSSDVIPALDQVFKQYGTPLATYCDQGQRFNNKEVRDFFLTRGVSLVFSPSGASQSTGMVEVGNQLLEEVLRKNEEYWEISFNNSTRNLYSRVIGHMGVAPSTILLDVDHTHLVLTLLSAPFLPYR